MIVRAVETIIIPTGDEYPVRGDLYKPSVTPARGIVVLCHGFKGFRRWGFLPHVAERLRAAGFAALSIDFSMNGMDPETAQSADRSRGGGRCNGGSIPGPGATQADTFSYPRPELFSRNTLKREHEDLSHVIQHVTTDRLGGHVDSDIPLGLFGHSRGGIVAILNALESNRIGALCTWAAADDPDFFTDKQKADWRRQGEYPFTDSKSGSRLAIGVGYLDDLEENSEFYNLGARVKYLNVPHLIIHGRMDMVVKVECALALHESERDLQDKRLVLLKTGHTFGVFYSTGVTAARVSEPLKQASDETVHWFETHLT
jgi:pimeloyl-ACP methyl ester carboxylesterase